MPQAVIQKATVATPFFNDAVAGAAVDLATIPAAFVAGANAFDCVFHVLFMRLVNTTGATAYLQVFSTRAASVSLGVTTPTWTFRLGANESVNIPVPWALPSTPSVNAVFASFPGLSVAGTTTATGNTGAQISVQALILVEAQPT